MLVPLCIADVVGGGSYIREMGGVPAHSCAICRLHCLYVSENKSIIFIYRGRNINWVHSLHFFMRVVSIQFSIAFWVIQVCTLGRHLFGSSTVTLRHILSFRTYTCKNVGIFTMVGSSSPIC